ncbi:MAG: AAA family ATPase [Caldisericum sp.]|uniref:AAA family ATPase n=1 Tax=Caldisericum sp. TaxID=2499687 RepID=UPI003D09BEFD
MRGVVAPLKIWRFLLTSFVEMTIIGKRQIPHQPLEREDDPHFNSLDFELLKEYAEGYELIAIDEAQYIKNIGNSIKMMLDNIPSLKTILTGSSSFNLIGQVGEPLNGRKITLEMFPIAQMEFAKLMNRYELKEKLEYFLIYGEYPAYNLKK